MTPSAYIISLSVSLLFSTVIGLWFYPNKRKVRIAFAVALLISLPLMLYAMLMPL